MEDEAQEKNVIIEGSSSWEGEKKSFQRRIKELESEIKEMNRKRLEDLKASDRALAVFASKEEEWRCEKKQLVNQLQFQRFNNTEDIHIKDESVAETSGKVISHSRYVAELKRQKNKGQSMLRNSLAEMEEWKLKAQEKKHVEAALSSVTEEEMRLRRKIEEKDAAGVGDSVQAEVGAKEMELSRAKNPPRRYTDGVGSREREAEKWKRLYLGLKLELDNLRIYRANAVREEDHSREGGETRGSSTVNTSRRLEAN